MLLFASVGGATTTTTTSCNCTSSSTAPSGLQLVLIERIATAIVQQRPCRTPLTTAAATVVVRRSCGDHMLRLAVLTMASLAPPSCELRLGGSGEVPCHEREPDCHRWRPHRMQQQRRQHSQARSHAKFSLVAPIRISVSTPIDETWVKRCSVSSHTPAAGGVGGGRVAPQCVVPCTQ